MPPIFIAYYTQGTGYADEAQELAHTLTEFGLDFDVRGVPNLGSWQANTSFKPTFIRNMMLEHEGRQIVYLDADARVRHRPILLIDGMDGIDFAAHWKDGHELLGGTLYFGPGQKSWELVRRWQQECAEHPDVWDQKNLQAVVETGAVVDLSLTRISPPYCLIYDLMASQGPPIIEHLQASRRLKHHV